MAAPNRAGVVAVGATSSLITLAFDLELPPSVGMQRDIYRLKVQLLHVFEAFEADITAVIVIENARTYAGA